MWKSTNRCRTSRPWSPQCTGGNSGRRPSTAIRSRLGWRSIYSSMEMDKAVCAACRRDIDAVARVCPYCGADPHSGQKIVDTQALLQEEFHPRKVSMTEGVLEYARQRQGIVIALGIVVLLVILAGVHAFIAQRNVADVSSAPAVPLTDIADLNSQSK